MADTSAPKPKGSDKNWLTKKVGPLPVWAYGALAVGAYYWYTHYGPGASKQKAGGAAAGGKRGGLKTYAPHITERITNRGRPPRGRAQGATPQGATSQAAASQAAPASAAPMMGGPVQPTAPTAGPIPPAGGKPPDKDKKPGEKGGGKPGDKDRGGAQKQTVVAAAPTGQPVDAASGQPVYWEWTHAHRGPEVSSPVPGPQQAYAPMTNGATYDAASTGASAAAALGG